MRVNFSKWAFPEKIRNPFVEDINGNFLGGRVKLVRIPGGMSKFEGKTRISKGVNTKNQGLTQKIDILNKGELFFFLEKLNTKTFCFTKKRKKRTARNFKEQLEIMMTRICSHIHPRPGKG